MTVEMTSEVGRATYDFPGDKIKRGSFVGGDRSETIAGVARQLISFPSPSVLFRS